MNVPIYRSGAVHDNASTLQKAGHAMQNWAVRMACQRTHGPNPTSRLGYGRDSVQYEGAAALRKSQKNMTKHRIYTTSFASVYPLYVAKAEKKGRTKAEVDEVISWLTGYRQKQLEAQLKKQTDFETFFAKAPKPNPARALITGVVCGVRVEEIEEPTMREIRYLDKLIDELAQGKAMDKILRKK
jgi:hypothetical protein